MEFESEVGNYSIYARIICPVKGFWHIEGGAQIFATKPAFCNGSRTSIVKMTFHQWLWWMNSQSNIVDASLHMHSEGCIGADAYFIFYPNPKSMMYWQLPWMCLSKSCCVWSTTRWLGWMDGKSKIVDASLHMHSEGCIGADAHFIFYPNPKSMMYWQLPWMCLSKSCCVWSSTRWLGWMDSKSKIIDTSLHMHSEGRAGADAYFIFYPNPKSMMYWRLPWILVGLVLEYLLVTRYHTVMLYNMPYDIRLYYRFYGMIQSSTQLLASISLTNLLANDKQVLIRLLWCFSILLEHHVLFLF